MTTDESPYTKRELDVKFINLETKMDQHLEFLGRIEEQTKMTNGSVAAIKIDQAKQQGYNKAMSIAASCGFIVLTSVLGWLLPQFVNLKAQVVSKQVLQDAVQAGVSGALNGFVIKPNQ